MSEPDDSLKIDYRAAADALLLTFPEAQTFDGPPAVWRAIYHLGHAMGTIERLTHELDMARSETEAMRAALSTREGTVA